MVLMYVSLAITAYTSLAVVTEVFKLSSMETTKQWNAVLREEVSIEHLLRVEVHVSEGIIHLLVLE
jgi:hypothetical protein